MSGQATAACRASPEKQERLTDKFGCSENNLRISIGDASGPKSRSISVERLVFFSSGIIDRVSLSILRIGDLSAAYKKQGNNVIIKDKKTENTQVKIV